MSWPFGEKVTVRRKTGVTQDGDGNDVPSYTSTDYSGVAIYPSDSTELVQGQLTVITHIHAVWSPAISLAAADELDVSTGPCTGNWKVDGDPKHYHSALTNSSVTDAVIVKVTG